MSRMEAPQFDIFISHAHDDREQYIVPLARAMEQSGITFWLDTVETGWGQDFVGGINRGLASARFMLFCLSRNFIGRRWPEAELWATLLSQARDGSPRVLPLILNSKEEVFARYPLLGSTAHLEFDQGIDVIAHAIAQRTGALRRRPHSCRVGVESVHTGVLTNLDVPVGATVQWLSLMAAKTLNLRTFADVGSFLPLQIRWVVVQAEARTAWERLSADDQHKAWGVFRVGDEIRISYSSRDRCQDFGMRDGSIFHLCAVLCGGHSPDWDSAANTQFAYAA